MKERKISKKELQKKLLDLLNFRLIGVLITVSKKDSIIPSELGGHLYLYDVTIIGELCVFRKLEIHVSGENRLLLQLLNDETVESYKFFKDIKDFKKKIGKIKEMLKVA